MISHSSAKNRAAPAHRCAKARRRRAHCVTRSGSSSLAATVARFPAQPNSWSQGRIVSAATSIPRRRWSSGARAAPRHRVRPPPNARGAGLSSARTERLSAGVNRRRLCRGLCALASSKVRVPARSARTIRSTLEREQKRTAATALGVRPPAPRSNRGRATKSPYRARRNAVRLRACASREISPIVDRGTATPR